MNNQDKTSETPAMLAEQTRIVNLVIERAEQACRYVLKHQQFDRDEPGVETEYETGFSVACGVCEGAIRQAVMRHIASDLRRTP